MTDAPPSTGPLAERLQQTRRSAIVLFALAVLLPAGCHVPLARQMAKLEALAAVGEARDATVTKVDAQGTVYLRYEYAGNTYDTSVRRDDAPSATVDGTLRIAVLPTHPTTVVVGDRQNAIARAATSRSLAWKIELGLFWFFGFGGGMGAWQYERMRRTGLTERDDPEGYRRRLWLTGIWLAPLLLAVFAHHASDAAAKGEPAWIVPLGAVFALGVLGATMAFVLREGVAKAAERAASLARWCVPLAVALALARLVLWLVAGAG